MVESWVESTFYITEPSFREDNNNNNTHDSSFNPLGENDFNDNMYRSRFLIQPLREDYNNKDTYNSSFNPLKDEEYHKRNDITEGSSFNPISKSIAILLLLLTLYGIKYDIINKNSWGIISQRICYLAL